METILQEIESLQYIQQTNVPTSRAWMWANEQLQPLFAQMAQMAKQTNRG